MGKLLIDTEDISNRWKQYIEELYNGEYITEDNDYIEQKDEVGLDFKDHRPLRESLTWHWNNLKTKR